MKVCPRCFGKIGKGISHNCSEASGVQNVVAFALQLASNFDSSDFKSHERVGTQIIKKAMDDHGAKLGEKFKLATGLILGRYVIIFRCVLASL